MTASTNLHRILGAPVRPPGTGCACPQTAVVSALARESPAVREVLEQVPMALAQQTKRLRIPLSALRCAAARRIGERAYTAKRAELVYALGLRGLSAVTRRTPADLLRQAGIPLTYAKAAGMGDGLTETATLQAVEPTVTPAGEKPLPSAGDPTTKPRFAADGFPASPPFRPGNWDFTNSTYMLAFGDTLSGLARLYLGGPQLWPDIWAPNRGKFPSADKIPAGKFINMPPAAVDGAKALLKAGAPASEPTPGAPGSKPGADPRAPKGATKTEMKPATEEKKVPWGLIAGGAAGLAALAAVVVVATR